ncbi:hypothetical protein V8F33_006359 [Rhypophila sp. PSN 637]
MDGMEYIAHNSEPVAPSSSHAQHAGPGAGPGTGAGAGQGTLQSQTQSAQQSQPQSLYQNQNQAQQPQGSGCPYLRGADHHQPHYHHSSHLPLPPQHAQFSQQQHPILNPHQAPGQSHSHHGFLSQSQNRNNSSHHNVSHLHYDPVHAANSNSNWYPDFPWPGSSLPPHQLLHHHHSRTASSDTYFNNLGHPQGPGSASLGVPGLGVIHSSGPHHHLPQHESLGPLFYRNLPPNVPRFPGINNNPNNPNTNQSSVNSAPPQTGLQQQPPSLAAARFMNLPAPNPPPLPPHFNNMSGSGESSPDFSTNRRPIQFGNMPDSMRGSNRNENGARAADLPPSRPTATSLANDSESPRPEAGAPSRSDQPGLSTPPPPSNTGRRRAYPGRAAMYAMHASDYDTDDELDQLEDDQQALRFMEQFSMGGMPRDMGEAHVRAHQILRGQVPNKRVASKKALSQLQSVDIDSLEESERTCVICYNEFGVENPEGINEAPLRLPSCKHVFGDHCIKKWFEESDSCPYCRDKVPSEPIIPSGAQYIRDLYRQFPGRDPRFSDMGNSRVPGQRGDEPRPEINPPRAWQTGDRRSPPSEASGGRRTRPRHSSFRGSPSTAGSHRHGSSHAAGSSSAAPVQQGQARERVNLPSFAHWSSAAEYSRRSLTPYFATQFTNQRPYQHSGNNAARFSMPPMPTFQPVELGMPPMPAFPDPLGLNAQPPMPPQMVAYPNVPNPHGTSAVPNPYSASGLGGPGAAALSPGGEPLPGPSQLDAYSQQLPPSASLPPVVASDGISFGGAASNGPAPTVLRFTRSSDGTSIPPPNR